MDVTQGRGFRRFKGVGVPISSLKNNHTKIATDSTHVTE